VHLASQTTRALAGGSVVGRQVDRPCRMTLGTLDHLRHSRHSGSAGLPTGQRVKRRLQMHLASPTSPAHVAISSDIIKKSFSATCWARMSRLEKAEFRKRLNMPSRGAMCGKPVAPRSTFSPRNRHRKCHFGERGHDRDGHLVSRSRRDRERVPARRP
jgi:hypothetical protein